MKKRTRALLLWGIIILIIGGGVGYTVWHIQAEKAKQAAIRRADKRNAARQKSTLKTLQKDAQADLAGNKAKYADVNNGDKNKQFRNQINAALAERHFVGTALAVKNGKTVYQRAFGYADQAHKRPNTVLSEYDINSVQKSMTATLLMQQLMRHHINLDAHLSEFYPEIKGANQITLRQMLAMRSGFSQLKSSKRVLSDKKVIKYATKHVHFNEDKVGQWQYAPVNYLLLTGVIEKFTHESYYKLFSNEIIQRLKLQSTGFAQVSNDNLNATIGYGGPLPRDYTHPYKASASLLANLLGTGNVTMSAGDLYQTERAILDGQLLGRKPSADLHRFNGDDVYAGGLYRIDNVGYYTHGMGEKYESTIAMSKDGKTAVVLLSNYFDKGDMLQQYGTKDTAINLFTDLNKLKKVK